MQFRPPGRRRRVGRFASISIAAVPFPACAADLALSPWGTYLFFAIVATVVIVLLLHEALDSERSDTRRRDGLSGETLGKMSSAMPRFGDDSMTDSDGDRRVS